MQLVDRSAAPAQIRYAHILGGYRVRLTFTETLLSVFRYHNETEYDDGDFMSTNIWKYAGELHHYSHFGIMGLLTVTQILSMVGVAGEINIMAWMYMEMLEMVLGLVVKLMRMYVYESAYSTSNDESAASADRIKAAAV